MSQYNNANKQQLLLDELNKKKAWNHVKKFGHIFARKLTEDTEFETSRGKEKAKAGSILCRSTSGECKCKIPHPSC